MVPAPVFSSQIISTARTAAQWAVSYLVAHVAVLQFLNPGQLAWLVDFVASGVILAAVTYLLRWLETRQGTGPSATLARRLASVLMLGLSGSQPAYGAPSAVSAPVGIAYPDGSMVQAAPEQPPAP